MMHEIYAVRDNRSGFYMKPFDARGVTDAVRMVSEVANDKNSMLYKHASDFSLYIVGKFDDITGVISVEETLPEGTVVWQAPMKINDIITLIKKEA